MKKLILLLFLFLIQSAFSQNADIELLRSINLDRNKNFDNTFKVITNSAAPISIALPIVMYGISHLKKDTLLLQKSVLIGASVFTAVSISTALKYSINRTRPFVDYPDIEKETSAGSPSFPSGHTSDAFSLATSFSIAYPKWFVIVPAYTWAGAVGYSRMDLGVHYPSDVLIGAIIGAGSAYLCYKAQKWLRSKPKKKTFITTNLGL